MVQIVLLQFHLQYFQYIITSLKQGIQGLQAFDLCVVTINDKHSKPKLTRKHRGYIII